jgi:hypothetical protein
MIRKVPCEIPDNCAYEIVMKVLGLLIGANYVIDARREFILVQLSCDKEERCQFRVSKNIGRQ